MHRAVPARPIPFPGMPRPASSGPPPIVVESISKTFRVPEERTHTLKERALHPLRRTRHETFKALQGISFDVRKGEFFGIAGRNGSGKSTLLKCMAGIYGVDCGRIWCNGRLSTFIELGVGFNQDLAARDNVVLNGIMMGLSPREARARYDAVIDFAELREFEELKLKNYSSGMHVRLAFSVAIQVDADILLVDEVLAVGDAAFQQKCFDVFNRLRDDGRTIVFVTHDMGALNRFCHRALLLERGAPVHLGEPHEVADRYLEINFGRDPAAPPAPRAGAATARRACSMRGSRTSTASGPPRYSRGGDSPFARASRSWSTWRTPRQACTSSTTSTSPYWSPRPPASTSAPGTSPPARRSCSRSPSRTCSPPAATARCSRSPTAAPAST